MTIEIFEFPAVPISKQLFHVPGAAVQGGLSAGGARIVSPEPGGFSRLEIQPAMNITEFNTPLMSWLMSMTNGEVLRLRLAPTPQISYSKRRQGQFGTAWKFDTLWTGDVLWAGNDLNLTFSAANLEGETTVQIDMAGIGDIIAVGHVIGHRYQAYLIQRITYDGDIATAKIKPPLRNNVSVGDTCYLRPYFIGRIGNPDQITTTYDAENNGNIQLPKIILNEAFVT